MGVGAHYLVGVDGAAHGARVLAVGARVLVAVAHHRLQHRGRRQRSLLLRHRVVLRVGGSPVRQVHVDVLLRLVGGGQEFCEKKLFLFFIAVV